MHQAADGVGLCDERNGGLGAIVSELIALVGHVRASIELIEAAIARETSTDEQHTTHVVVLDDVTPQYVRASCALNACNASLGTALQFLLDARMSEGQSIPLTPH